MTTIPEDKLEGIISKGKELEKQLGQENTSEKFVELSKEYSEIQPLYNASMEWRESSIEIADLKNIIEDESSDNDMKDLASEELSVLEEKILKLSDEIKLLLLPKDKADSSDVILEIRAGTGGDEAALFAGDLYRMYQRFSDINGWKTEIISISDGDVGGFKEVIISIAGNGVFSKLKFESGVHRVQRVPTTESSGRVHTSAATVAVLPEPEDVDIQIEEKDIRVDVFRASGPGGQSVNTTDSAVRITHLPTRIVVQCQNERSQHKNKETCYKMLKARLYEYEIQKREEQNQKNLDSKTDIGWGHQIRSYVLQPYQLVKDLRNKIESTNPSRVLDGNIDEFIEEGIKNR